LAIAAEPDKGSGIKNSRSGLSLSLEVLREGDSQVD